MPRYTVAIMLLASFASRRRGCPAHLGPRPSWRARPPSRKHHPRFRICHRAGRGRARNGYGGDEGQRHRHLARPDSGAARVQRAAAKRRHPQLDARRSAPMGLRRGAESAIRDAADHARNAHAHARRRISTRRRAAHSTTTSKPRASPTIQSTRRRPKSFPAWCWRRSAITSWKSESFCNRSISAR